MTRSLSPLVIAALVALAPSLALAEDGGRGPAGGAFMSSYSTPPGGYVQPSTAPASAFAVQSAPPGQRQPVQDRRRTRSQR